MAKSSTKLPRKRICFYCGKRRVIEVGAQHMGRNLWFIRGTCLACQKDAVYIGR